MCALVRTGIAVLSPILTWAEEWGNLKKGHQRVTSNNCRGWGKGTLRLPELIICRQTGPRCAHTLGRPTQPYTAILSGGESFQGLWPGFLAVQLPILSHYHKGSWAAAPAPCCFEQTSSAHNCHTLPFGLGLCQVKPEPCTSSDEQNPARHFAFLQSEVVAVALCQCIVKSCSFITKPIQFYINWCIYRD